jgi:AAHS family 4-hydroxybenzoate transporter-like MFS transporter
MVETDLVDKNKDAIGRRTWVSTFGLLLALVSEGYDLQAANFAAPAIVRSLGITKAQIGPLLSSSLVGVLLGAALIGPLGDRVGRKRLIIAGCMAYGLCSLVAASATTLQELVLVRFLIGLGLGGVLPNALALTSELASRGSEATAAGFIGIGITLGGVFAGLAASILLVQFGWQSIFLVGGVLPLLIVALLLLILPESPAFLAARAQRAGRPALHSWLPGPGVLFHHELALQTSAIWLTFAAILMCVYLLSGWIPLLLNQSGFSASRAALIGAAYHGGGVMGGITASLCLRRRGWDVVAIFAGLACVTMVFLVEAASSTALLVAGVVGAGFFVTGTQNAINGAGGVSYTPDIRSSGLGWALGIGRLGSIAGPLVGSLAVVLGMKEARQLFALPVLPLAVAVATALWLRRRASFQWSQDQS